MESLDGERIAVMSSAFFDQNITVHACNMLTHHLDNKWLVQMTIPSF